MTETTRPRSRVDGNAAAGRLMDVLGRDVTAARGGCLHCGHEARLAEAIAELDGEGVILLCRSCEHTLLTLVATASGELLSVRGLDHLSWPAATP